MKKASILVLALFSALVFMSCGEAVPTKELESAKTAMERANSVEAPVYAPQDYMAADSDYQAATNFVVAKKNKEAKLKAQTSVTNANIAYENARVKRAGDIFSQCTVLLDEADKNFASKNTADAYAPVRKDYDALKVQNDSKDYDNVYSNGIALKPKLEDVVKAAQVAMNDAKSAIAGSQDKYDAANNKDIVHQYASEDMSAALAKLDDARKDHGAGDAASATAKAKEAEAMVAAAVQKAQDEYQKALDLKQKEQQAADLQKQQELEAQKQKAAQYIEEAKKKLEELKAKNKGNSFLAPISGHFAYSVSQTEVIGQMAEAAPTESSNKTSENDSNLTLSTVENLIQQADDSYQKEEYLDAMDYAREAIRAADILLAKPEEPTTVQVKPAQETNIVPVKPVEEQTYTVQLKPKDRDCLWKIAGYVYDNKSYLWPAIWRANKFQIQDPDLIYPGMVLKIPPTLAK